MSSLSVLVADVCRVCLLANTYLQCDNRIQTYHSGMESRAEDHFNNCHWLKIELRETPPTSWMLMGIAALSHPLISDSNFWSCRTKLRNTSHLLIKRRNYKNHQNYKKTRSQIYFFFFFGAAEDEDPPPLPLPPVANN